MIYTWYIYIYIHVKPRDALIECGSPTTTPPSSTNSTRINPLLEPQSRFGDKLLEISGNCPQNGDSSPKKGLTHERTTKTNAKEQGEEIIINKITPRCGETLSAIYLRLLTGAIAITAGPS